MIKAMLLSIIYLLSCLSKGLSRVGQINYQEKININFWLEDVDSLKISICYLF